MKLSRKGRSKLAGKDFALPKLRALPIYDYCHVRAAYGRASEMLRLGHITRAEYASARKKIEARHRALVSAGDLTCRRP
jgi:hypothetical protein